MSAEQDQSAEAGANAQAQDGQQESTSPSSTQPESTTVSKVPRAARACRRCHRKKLRCFGGCPCANCKRAHQSCDFGEATDGVTTYQDFSVRTQTDERFTRLEKMVESLLKQVKPSQQLPSTSVPLIPSRPIANPMPSDTQAFLDTYLADPPSTESTSISTGMSILPSLNPGNDLNSQFQIGKHGASAERSSLRSSDGRKAQTTAESRLALSQVADRHGAPFRPMAFHPANWENSDHSKPPSPISAGRLTLVEDEFWAPLEVGPTLHSDPLSLGLIDENIARGLVDVFIQFCHPFLPVLDFIRSPFERLDEAREMGPYLFTVILGVAARFRETVAVPNSKLSPTLPYLDPNISQRIRRLAYAHFASCPLRRYQNLRDLQATLFLAGWGLHPPAEGPESWQSTGYCGRLAYRFGLHKLGQRGNPQELFADKTQDEKVRLLARYKTWLCWWCFDTAIELGFGRSTPIQSEPNETFLLDAVESDPSLSGDLAATLCLVGQTRLCKISRKLGNWLQNHNDEDRSFDDLLPMLQHLNEELDVWCRTWVFKGSVYYFRLGQFAKILKLRSENLRLSLNSLALRGPSAEPGSTPSPEPSNLVDNACMAAIEILQTRIDSGDSNHYLSFCLDYVCHVIGHALVFLVRLYQVGDNIPIDRSVILHYLEMGIDVMETTDNSINLQSTHIGKTCRELCRAAGVPLKGMPATDPVSYDQSAFPAWPFDIFVDTNLFPDMGSTDQMDAGWLMGLPTLTGNGLDTPLDGQTF